MDDPDFARKLRKKMSLPEVLLWEFLRRDSTGYRVRRQFPITPYVLDFYCPKLKVDIEVDGEFHDYRVEQDLLRSEFLKAKGIITWRYPAKFVLESPYDAFVSIKWRLEELDGKHEEK